MVSVQETDKPQVKWYLKPGMIIVWILAVGPLALPLIWISPALSKKLKIILTIVTVILTILLLKATAELYAILLKEMQALAEALK